MTFPLNPVLTDAPPYPFAKLEARKAELRKAGRTLFDFTLGDPLEPTPAFIREALRANVPEVSQYPTVAGKASLRRAIASYIQRRFGVTVDPEREVIPAAGAKEAVFHLAFALVDRASDKRTVVYGEPAYPVYERGAAYAGADVFAAPLSASKGFLLEPGDVPDAVLRKTALFWVNYPHNPTGAVADVAYYNRVVDAARTYGFLVASDETYVDVAERGRPPSILEVAKDHVLAIHSLSKRSGMTAYRSGFMAGDARVVDALKKLRPSVGVASQEFVQAAAEAAWGDDAHVQDRVAVFARKRVRVVATVQALGLDVLDSGAGLYVWAKVPPGETSGGYAERLLESGVVVTPGDAFGPSGSGYFRLALVPLLSELDAALDAWARAHRGA